MFEFKNLLFYLPNNRFGNQHPERANENSDRNHDNGNLVGVIGNDFLLQSYGGEYETEFSYLS